MKLFLNKITPATLHVKSVRNIAIRTVDDMMDEVAH